MSSGADINAGGATVYLNLATNARNANVAAAIRNELHQVQNVTRIFSNVTHNSLTNVTGIWNRTTQGVCIGPAPG